MTLAWAIRPVVGGNYRAAHSLQQHYRSFFKPYIADKADQMDGELPSKRTTAIESMIKALVNAKKDDWDAVIFRVHQQLGSLDIDK